MSADDLAKILDELGKRLGPAGQHVFELAVRQVYVNALTAAIALVVVIVGGIIVIPRAERWRTAKDADPLNGRDMILIFPAVGYGFMFIGTLIWALSTIPQLVNPEYAAIKDILGAIGGTR